MGISLEVRAGPVLRIEPGIKLLLQGAQIPAFGMTRRPRPAQHRLPASVRNKLLHATVGVLYFQPKEEARLAQRPSAVTGAVEQDRSAQDVCPRLQEADQIQR